MKTYVITLSKKFMKGHPKAGNPTNFINGFISHDKIHTIRANYTFWEKRFKKIEAGEAILSVRYWAEKPYKSPQIEIEKFTRWDNIGIQKIEFTSDLTECIIDGKHYSYTEVAKNDGLLPEDFLSWFKSYDTSKPLAIIHFTKFRY